METRANFVLIGIFTLLSILGTLGFFVWLASVQIDRQYTTYGILFDDVSGLDASGDVLFNGISVGRVISLRIADQDPSKVFTTIEVDAETPVRADTVAQLQSQGVTGVSYISLSGGTPGAAPLLGDGDMLPVIPSRKSTVQTLVEEAPDLLLEATKLLEQFQILTGPENQAYVSRILRNLDASSGRLDQALSDFSQITDTVSQATGEITRFTDRLEAIALSVEATLKQADGALVAAQGAFETVDQTLSQSGTAITNAEGAFAQAERIMREDVPDILQGLADTITESRTAIADLQARSAATLDGYAETSGLLNARLTELETTLSEASTAFYAVTDAATSFDDLVDGDGTLLVAEARVVLADAKAAIATIQTVVLDDLPPIMSDIRAGVTAAGAAVDTLTGDLVDLGARFDPMAEDAQQAIASATALFDRAQGSLGAIERTLGVAEGTLGSARTAFDSAGVLLDTDLAPVLRDIRKSSSEISKAVTDVTADIPAITSDLRALIARSDAVVRQLQRAVVQSAPGLGTFANRGLPELTRLTTEARGLVSSLGGLVRRIEQNPARFLLDDRVPEYRR